jgi:hypothetical protein
MSFGNESLAQRVQRPGHDTAARVGTSKAS